MPAAAAPTTPPTIEPTIGRVIRLVADDHAALLKAARRGEQNTYIIKALRAQLRRDGFLTVADDKQPSLFSRRRAVKRSVKTRARRQRAR